MHVIQVLLADVPGSSDNSKSGAMELAVHTAHLLLAISCGCPSMRHQSSSKPKHTSPTQRRAEPPASAVPNAPLQDEALKRVAIRLQPLVRQRALLLGPHVLSQRAERLQQLRQASGWRVSRRR